MNHEGAKTQRNTKDLEGRFSVQTEAVAKEIVDIAFKIHKELGPGFVGE